MAHTHLQCQYSFSWYFISHPRFIRCKAYSILITYSWWWFVWYRLLQKTISYYRRLQVYLLCNLRLKVRRLNFKKTPPCLNLYNFNYFEPLIQYSTLHRRVLFSSSPHQLPPRLSKGSRRTRHHGMSVHPSVSSIRLLTSALHRLWSVVQVQSRHHLRDFPLLHIRRTEL